MLDCYLWLISDDPQVESTIGFHPEKIVVSGDSAGANLSMALMLALRDIRQTLTNSGRTIEGVRYPNGIFCYYPPCVRRYTFKVDNVHWTLQC